MIAATKVWLERAVIGLNLCPFAKSVYVKDQVRYVVSSAHTGDAVLDDLTRELQALSAADPALVDTTLLILPQALQAFADFADFLDLVEVTLKVQGLTGTLQVASFHPQYQFADAEENDISNYTNRAPYPILHLLREASLARAIRHHPDPSRIYQENMATLNALGLEGWRALGVDAPSGTGSEQISAAPRDEEKSHR
nr:hypothetical protein [uncultured bacterium]QLG20510.1 hypothetical protein [uncultured bacterium]